MRRAPILWSIMVLLVLLALEALSYAALHVVEAIRPGYVLDLFVPNHFAAITQEQIDQFRAGAYDPVLGWNSRPLSRQSAVNVAGRRYTMNYGADGSRRDQLVEDPPLVTVYGDSLMAGDEVDDHQTWPYLLETMLHRDVRNFGTNGFGTGQALMKFERHVRDGLVAPITILGVNQGINRVVNAFRPYYVPRTGIVLGFKPTHRCPDGRLHAIPNPLRQQADRAALERLAWEVAAWDPYARSMLRLSWPHSLQMARLVWELSLRGVGGDSWLFAHRSLDLWDDVDAAGVMDCILARFVELARTHGSHPVLLFIHPLDRPPPYADYLRSFERARPDVTVVDLARERFDVERFRITPTRGHPSLYGNQVIAAAVSKALANQR